MEFKTRREVEEFIKKSKYLGGGSQGECYLNQDLAYKFYFSFLDPIEDDPLLTKDEILKYKDIDSNIFIFPQDVVFLNGEIIGDITKYAKACNLYKINPLTIDLNRLLKLCAIALKEIELISKRKIRCFDMLYNILLGDSFYIIDTIEYTLDDYFSYEELNNINQSQFNLEVIWFLISGLFDEIIAQNKELNEMYREIRVGNYISLLEFINKLKNYLSEIIDYEIDNLGDARKLINKKHHNSPYERLIVL